MTRKKLIIITLLLFLFFVLAAVFGYGFYVYNSVTGHATLLNEEELAVNKELTDKVVNLALFGLDGRDDYEVEGDRTDVIMIGTLDTRDNSVKVTSVMRDTYAKICVPDDDELNNEEIVYAGDTDGIEWTTTIDNTQTTTDDGSEIETTDTGTEETDYPEEDTRVIVDYENKIGVAQYDKINAAYSVGGVAASIKTLNENFDLNIKDYITVDFVCVIEVVDILGGITIDIPNEEVLEWTNEYLKESNFWGNRNDPPLTELGVQTVTGAQALAFARNRYSDSDYGRTMRQREVVEGIFEKAKDMNIFQAINLLDTIYPYIETSLSLEEMTEYARVVLSSGDMSFEGYRIPTNEYGTSGFINSIWYLFPDTLVDNVIALHHFIYGENQSYTPSYTVQQISQVIMDQLDYNATGITREVGAQEEKKVLNGLDAANESELDEYEVYEEESGTPVEEETEETYEDYY